MKKIFVLFCGLLVNTFSFSQTIPSKPKLYTREEALKIWSPVINIIGKNRTLEALNAATGLSSSVTEEDLTRFNLAIILTPPLCFYAFATVTASLITAGYIVTGLYIVAKDVTKGEYVVTKDGIIALKEIAKDSTKIVKKMHAFLFKKNSKTLQNNESSSLQKA